MQDVDTCVRHSALAVVALVLCCAAHAEDPNDEALIRIEEGKVYRVVNGENIYGHDILDLLVEKSWATYLSSFITDAIEREAIAKAKIEITPEETDAEINRVLAVHPQLGRTIEQVGRNYGEGVLTAMRRKTRVDLGLVKLLQRDNKLTANDKTDSRAFAERKKAFFEKELKLVGIVTDPVELGEGAGVQIGVKKYSRDEVRQYIVEAEGQVQKGELDNLLYNLTLQKLVEAAARKRKLVLTEDDRNFYFSFLARLAEQKTGVPGRAVMMQSIQEQKMTPEQYLHSRLFGIDALATVIAKDGQRLAQIKAEYEAHPEDYKIQENLAAHIFVQVLDPDGHPYTEQWQANGHGAVNAFVDAMREKQFEAAKSKIDGLLPLAKDDFEETARKYSDDTRTRKAGGLLGRIGPNVIPSRPLDKDLLVAISKLKPGEVAGPIRSAYGWHIVKCLEKQEVTFDEVDERVYMNLIHKRKDALVKQLIETAKIEDKY